MAEKSTEQNMANKSTDINKSESPTYTVEEIAEAAGVFGATPDLVRAAFAVAGKAAATETEAKKIIDKFKKEVK